MKTLTPGGIPRLRAIALEFAGVVAEDGLHATLCQLAERNRHHPDVLFKLARQALYDTGYITGACTHADFWLALQRRIPLHGRPAEFSDMVVQQYALRPRVMAAVRTWRAARLTAVLLADNTDWLVRFEERNRLFHEFDHVFNSFHLHRTKRDPELFAEVARTLVMQPAEILLVDTSPDALSVARKQGFQTMLFGNPDRFLVEFEETLGRNAARA